MEGKTVTDRGFRSAGFSKHSVQVALHSECTSWPHQFTAMTTLECLDRDLFASQLFNSLSVFLTCCKLPAWNGDRGHQEKVTTLSILAGARQDVFLSEIRNAP